MKTYEFTICLRGTGENEDAAWQDAIFAFSEDPGDWPEPLVLDDDEWEEE